MFFFRRFVGNQKLHSRWGFAGVAIISAFQSFRWQKKIAFSLRIHSKTDGSLHSRCGFAVVALKIRIFSALTKGVLLFRDVSLTAINPRIYTFAFLASRCGFAGVAYNLFFKRFAFQ